MSKFQIVKGIIDNLANAPYVEGKVYFVYNNATSTNLSIYADIDGTRKKIYDPSVDGLDAIESQLDELYVREDEFASRVGYELDPFDGSVSLYETIAADETTKTLYENFTSLNNQIDVITPDKITEVSLLFYIVLILQHRLNLIWMNGSEIESSILQIKANTQTKAIILYAKGKSSIAYGIAGVDSEWTIGALYELPPATTSTLGGVKIGNGLVVESDGTLNSNLDYAASPMSGGNAVKANGILYATVDSTSTSTNFTATVNGLTELYDGACVILHNGIVTSAKGFTVNINGLGAKKCYSNMTNATQETTIFNVNYTLMFIYSTTLDSGNGGWWIYRGYDANTTYTPVKLGFGYGHCTTAATTVAKTVAISSYVLNTGGIVSVLFDHDVQASATLNVNSKGAKAIYHKGAAITDGIIKAGDTATFMYSEQYHLVSIDHDADITVDSEPTNGSTNPVSSGGIYDLIHWVDSENYIYTQVEATDFVNLTGAERPRYNNSNLALQSEINAKQDTLVSGTNIKTINGNSLLGTGDLSDFVTQGSLDSKLTDYVSSSTFKTALDETERVKYVIADATAAAAIEQIMDVHVEPTPPSSYSNVYLITLAVNNRHYLMWTSGTILECAPLQFEIDTATHATTMYAHGRHSIAHGIAADDDSWTIEALPEDAEGRAY